MRPRKRNRYSNAVTIFHHKLNLSDENNTTFFLITEMEDGKPRRTYYFQIPENYSDDSLLGELHERYCPYCPN
jgi:hypothetical protein